MKPLPKKIFLPGTTQSSHEQLHSASDVVAEQGRLAMGTGRAGPGWACWLFAALIPQLAMGSPERSGQAISDTMEKREKSLWLPLGQICFLST